MRPLGLPRLVMSTAGCTGFAQGCAPLTWHRMSALALMMVSMTAYLQASRMQALGIPHESTSFNRATCRRCMQVSALARWAEALFHQPDSAEQQPCAGQ